MEPGDRWLCPLPLHHVGGLGVLIRSVINHTTAVVHERFDVERVRATLEAGEVTLVSLVPTMLARLRDAGPPRGARACAPWPSAAGRCRPTCSSGRPTAGIPVAPVYGMTETALAGGGRQPGPRR